MTVVKKRKVSLSLDEDLVEAFEALGPGGLSPEINNTLRQEYERRQQRQRLRELLDELSEQDGPLNTLEDQKEIVRLQELLR